jgi:hypothetical protein
MSRLFLCEIFLTKLFFRKNNFLEIWQPPPKFGDVWQPSPNSSKPDYDRNLAKIAGFQPILAESSLIWPKSCKIFQISACAAEFRQSDIKIRGSSTVDSNNQQTLMPSSGRFPQMCIQE